MRNPDPEGGNPVGDGQISQAEDGPSDKDAPDATEPVSAERGGDSGEPNDRQAAPPSVETRGQRNIRWIEENCVIPEGKFVGQPVKLRVWQKGAILRIYDNPAGTRTAIISFGRKNAKTALAAFLLLLHLCGPEAKENSALYSTAMAKEQAAKIFDLAAKVVRLSATLRPYVGIKETVKHLYYRPMGTVYKALSAEATTAFGFSPIFTVHDELGQVIGPRSQLFEAMETASAAHENPLSIIISTQAASDGDLLSNLIDTAHKDPHTVLVMFSAPEDLDPFSEEAIRAANPAFGDFMNDKEVLGMRDAAQRLPARESAYRNLILNQRVTAHTPLVPRSLWRAAAGQLEEDVFATGPVFMGLDLSARNDLTALAMVAKGSGDTWHGRVFFWAPQQGLIERATRDRVPYDVWARDGILLTTPSASIEYGHVAEYVSDLCDRYPVEKIAFDRWRIDVFKAEVAKLGRELPLEPFGQGYKDMTPAIEAFEAELMNGRLRHEDHPILNWCAANAIAVKDPAGNRKLDKSKSTGRIDGMVALVMALGQASRDADEAGAISSFFTKPISAQWR